ncbi:EamA family transporter RarD [Desulfovibrio sulfodismutans]|uniref:EamA family transporter RarD n=1 Tax=Desulfolutivibrio sulfodismutans TaxID=63561 RepID=A0A7K3NKR8_9BACT|nr:EamA family transporter RarD [Desulfolutivibrio sulfodismutans]NDY56707.1 EamA family transporter RarD [Desulfolutivibrio sulfodismutans]QLA13490.1 EamA family transporter RarD [Desulfolutivibrio sulfodismutans DSM 3696]
MPAPHTLSGVAAALFAFVSWGLLPIYWKSLADVAPVEILCHRLVWSLLAAGAALVVMGRLGEARRVLSRRRDVLLMASCGLLLGVNWLLFIQAVNSGHVVEASLGYFINPLVNMVLGAIFFRERLSRLQALAVALAVIGVGISVVAHGRLPWIALALAGTFGVYGLLRKLMRVESLPGLFFETAVLGVPAGFYLWGLWQDGRGAFLHLGQATDVLLLCAGVVTAAPLLAFAFAARRLRLTSLGILQYIAPTCMFLLGVLVYGEPFDPARAATFCCIWAGVAVYTVDAVLTLRRIPGGKA